MKKLLLLMTFVICALGVNAQTTKVVTGAVIDQNGNPLPNALVEATGGAESVTTDADGSYSIEVSKWLKSLTASYAGFPSKTKKIVDGTPLIFEMKPKTSAWFADFAYAACFVDGGDYFTRLGVMGGYLGKWGGYFKLQLPLETDECIPSVTVGAIKQVTKPFYIYFGTGFSPVFYSLYYYDDCYFSYESGAMFDIGTIFRINKFNLGIGYSIGTNFYDTIDHSIQVHVGYCF